MRLTADDWHFVNTPNDGSVVAVDLFLDNGQHARMLVYPLINPNWQGEQIPEIVVLCEMPGEKLTSENQTRRWITRAPDKSCSWSGVELSATLIRQINERLDAAVA